MEGSRLASRFWLLVCCISFIAAALTWGERPATPGAEAARVPTATPADVEPASDAAVPEPPPAATPSPVAAADPPRAAAPAAPLRVLPSATDTGTTVLRCTLRGRVTYVDPSSACPEGATAKLTVLPR